MHADLERLIALQKVDSAILEAQRTITGEPERAKALDERLAAGTDQVNVAKARLAENQNARRAIEKDVAVHQGRLSKFRDQLMAVKTNVEYQAMQKEIGYAQNEVKGLEDKILELMVEADDLAASVKAAESAFAAEQKQTDADRQALTAGVKESRSRLEQLTADRARLAAALDPQVLATFELVARRRNGIALAEARDGICTICHVRLRPQVYNTVLRNEQILQCDSCHRILYSVPRPAATAADAARTAPAE
jgi:hypothetical protein